MSKGTTRYTFRLPAELVNVVTATVDLRNSWSREEPWNLSDFVRIALEEKVRKMDRSRRRKIADALVWISGTVNGADALPG